MKKQVLAEILGQRASTGEENARFLYELQLSVLAALKECGSLTELQFSYRADMLKGAASGRPFAIWRKTP